MKNMSEKMKPAVGILGTLIVCSPFVFGFIGSKILERAVDKHDSTLLIIGTIFMLLALIPLVAFLITVFAGVVSCERKAKEERARLKEELKSYASFSERDRWTLDVKKLHPKFSAAFSIETIMVTQQYYNPEKYIYSSATVGGITTGGVSKIGGDYTKGKEIDSEKRKLKYFGQEVKRIQLSGELLKKATQTKIKEYLNEENQIVVVSENNAGAVVMAARIAGERSLATQYAMYAGYPSQEKCREIIDWLCDASKSEQEDKED